MNYNILNEILNISKKLMKCITIKENFGEFEKAFEIIKEELKNYYIEEIYINNYKNLIISNTKDKNLDIIFCGHMDVVPAEKYEPIVKNGKLYGRGSFDMKSQLAVITSILKNHKSNKKIAFIITSDEEIGGYCCKEIIKKYNSKLAVIPDAGRDFNLIVEEKGLLQLEIKINGKSAHASEPFKGENAIVKAMDLYNKILNIYKMPNKEDEFITSVNLSKLNGGTANNTVASSATMVLDIRFTSDQSIEHIIKNIKNINKDIEINVLDCGPVFYVDKNIEVIKKFKKDAEDILNKKIKINKCLATSDAIYFSEKNIPTILINPKGNYWHSPNEYVEIDSLYTLYKIFSTLL